MGRERIEVEIEPITGEEREAARGQALSQGVDDAMRHVLRAGPRWSTGRILVRGSMASHSQSTCVAHAEPGAQFVQLQVRELEVAEEALVQSLSVLACAGEPGGDGGLTVAEDPFGGGRIQPFGQRRSAPWRSAEKGFSDGTRACRAWQ